MMTLFMKGKTRQGKGYGNAMKKQAKRGAGLAVLLLLFIIIAASCDTGDAEAVANGGEGTPSTAARPEGAASDELYTISEGDLPYATVVDRNGRFILHDRNVSIIYRAGSVSAVGVKLNRYGENGEIYSALYSVGGELLRDFAPCDYHEDSGDMIRMYETVKPPKGAGEGEGEENGSLYRIGARYMLIDSRNGEPVSGEYREDGEGSKNGEVDRAPYYDDDNYFYRDKSVGIIAADGGSYKLINNDGKTLFDGADMLEPFEKEADGKAITFFAEKKGMLYVLSREGEVSAKMRSDDNGVVSASGGFVFIGGKAFDSKLNIVIEGKYEVMRPLTCSRQGSNGNDAGGKEVLFIAAQNPSGSNEEFDYDIFDTNGNLLWSKVRSPSGYNFVCGPDRIVLQRGFKRGLADTQGNWIYEESIFHRLED
jgi:hypothetical protein